MISFSDLTHGQLVFTVGEYRLNGLRLLKYIDFPWNSKQEMSDYIEDLERQNTERSYRQMINLHTKRALQKIHIMMSWAYVFLFTGLISAFVSVTAQLNHEVKLALFVSCFSLLSYFGYILLKVKSKNRHMGLLLLKDYMEKYDTWPKEEKNVQAE